jgi:hypothetical protein
MKTARAQSAYTMIEIAIAIAVIGFALVAIIGILPSGMQVQKDNREDTIINQDGVFWLEAIRSGATGSVALTQYVDFIVDHNGNTNYLPPLGTEFNHSHEVLGALTSPRSTFPLAQPVIARVRAITGPAVTQGKSEMNFKYYLHASVMNAPERQNAYEIRLSFYWPVRPDGSAGNNFKMLRTVVAGSLTNFDAGRGLWQILPNQF